MADVVTLEDVSTKDAGSGSQLKTGGRRKHNMPKSCVERKIKAGMSRGAAEKACGTDPRFAKGRKQSSDIKLAGKVHRDYKKQQKKRKRISKGY